MKKKVLIGMSGGVDSSVAAALLQKRGFDVTGGFIKNWSDTKDLWTGECQWRADRRDAMRVAATLGISLLTFDFEDTYRKKVLDEFFEQYKSGETPNPDVLCNEVIKFGLFLEEAKKLGFDYVATGHYARVKHGRDGVSRLMRGVDENKDQSYFLYRVSQEALRMTLFPLGELKKSEVRKKAKAHGLATAEKEESQGICFVGEVPMASFLRKKIKAKPGDIVTPEREVLGQHKGLDLYTIGQRQGLDVSTGGKAWYVASKDMKKNRLTVVPDKNHPLLFSKSAVLHDLHWTQGRPPSFPVRVSVQVRYRQEPVRATLAQQKDGKIELAFKEPVRAVAPGQSAVIYKGKECLGGGIIAGKIV